MTTTWWWVRHGPTHQKTIVGWRDVPADLSDHIRIQKLNAFLPKDALLVSSDLQRASATADAISDGRTRLPHDPALREFDFGRWDGLGFDKVARLDPTLSRAFWENPGDIAPPGGESWNAVAKRAAPAVEAINSRYAGRNIIAVAHIGIIMTQIQMASGTSPSHAISHKIDNLSVTRLHLQNGVWSVGAINHIP